jgi:hypothetical protein
MLSRSNTAPPAPAPQEKQGGFRQVVVPLLPTPTVNSKPREPVPKSPNGDAHADADVGPGRHHADADVDAVLQGDKEAAAHQPPTPAKDEALAGSRTPALVAVAVGASEA